MAGYDASKEERNQLLAIQKNNRGDWLIINSIKIQGKDSTKIDIRNYYTNENDEILPTAKGVRFDTESLKEVIIGLLSELDVVELEDIRDEITNKLEDNE